jgi:hypothetical protein
MEYLYTVHTKLIDSKTYYFVKKLMALSEFKGSTDVVVGFGMHNDFDKACSIAGIDDLECRKKLLHDFEKQGQPAEPIISPVKPVEKKRIVEIDDSVNNWLAMQSAEVLN